MDFSFDERLAFSRGRRERTDKDTIRKMIPGCIRVEKTSKSLDRRGIDYIATLRRGAEIFIDAKARDYGCSKFWHGEPDLALEIWSVVRSERCPSGKAGWTLNESSVVDLILFTFDRRDTDQVFLLGFQPLRFAFVRNIKKWIKKYKIGEQTTKEGWKSRCIFVPVSIVYDAMRKASIGAQKEIETICDHCLKTAYELKNISGSRVCADCEWVLCGKKIWE